MSLENYIKKTGKELGFEKVAIAKAKRYAEHDALQNWLSQGFHGTMQYMERGAEKRQDPRKVMPEARSVITCALNYNTDHPYSTECHDSGKGWIARYAWGDDYHPIMESKLSNLSAHMMQNVSPPEGGQVSSSCKFYVDTGPVMERVFAKNSGIGWMGKNTCIIDPKLGSWLFLGVILTDLELQPDSLISDHCGKCTACIDACPTQAITESYKVDARRCISYLTIEHKGEIEPELASKMGNHILGCDICQDVCPWNRKAPKTGLPAFQPRHGFFNPDLESFEKKVRESYPGDFKNSPLKRPKPAGLLRNIQIALTNQKNKK
ncbi:MAG: tRNA epoxyqueuosine(34) reductase QueG [Deltaproteobacteria bacterium]|nr:tRNA epoxyqueuosine(34) reductase QueG [Deltaproteobacteria bacterium]